MRESLLRLCKDIKESGPKSPEIQSSSPKQSQKVKKLKEIIAVIPKIEKVEEPEEDDWWIQNPPPNKMEAYFSGNITTCPYKCGKCIKSSYQILSLLKNCS